jgi:hypothetical protein
MDRTKRLFFSFVAVDAEFSHGLMNAVESRGWSAISVPNAIRPGDLWAEAVRGEIEAASAIVLVIPGEDVANRNYIWFEVGAAKALGKRVLAVLPPERRPKTLPLDLADVVVLDAGRRSLETIVDTIIMSVPEGQAMAGATV